ncbi:hypothetical protein AAVH_17573 [Aphelenchoides avenae]|nr:hypothetical protein AAVH_17573 [Aphelenchus avenae]
MVGQSSMTSSRTESDLEDNSPKGPPLVHLESEPVLEDILEDIFEDMVIPRVRLRVRGIPRGRTWGRTQCVHNEKKSSDSDSGGHRGPAAGVA